MADRLVGLLWNIVASPDAPKEVLHSGILADVASVYKVGCSAAPPPPPFPFPHRLLPLFPALSGRQG